MKNLFISMGATMAVYLLLAWLFLLIDLYY